MSRRPTGRRRVHAAVVLAATLALAAMVTHSALDWSGRSFPGFFVLRNRVVASVGLPAWPIARAPHLFQATVVAVDGAPVADAAAVYARVAAAPAGTRFAYTFEKQGRRTEEIVPSRLFTWWDTFALFGAYLLNGVVYAAIGVGVWLVAADRAATWALLGLGLCASVYSLTGMDLYGPHTFFRLHALAESVVPAAFVQLALLFPVRRTTILRAALWSYTPVVALAIWYQLALDDPTRYPEVHATAMSCWAAAGFFLIWSAVAGYFRSNSELVRQRVRVVVFGLVAGLAAPVPLAALSVLEGTPVPANLMAYTAFVFPLSIAYAIHKRDLFQIDALVQRGLYYGALTGIVSVAYFACAVVASQVLQASFADVPAFSLAFTLVVLIVMPQLRDRVQRLVDLVFARRRYDPQEVLAAASTALGQTLELHHILELTLRFPADALGLAHVAIFMRGEGVFAEAAHWPGGGAPSGARLPADAPLVRRLTTTPSVLIRDMLDGDPEAEATRGEFDTLGAALLVPLACQGAPSGFLACGPKKAGTFFNATDVSFLRTFANHVALSLQNARTYHDLQVLNADLEHRVTERTQQLAASTERLSTSLTQLESAYATLQTSQKQLIAAQKMAAFGRLAAQIAHEMNTPLGAALNHLHVAREIAAECESAAADPAATPAERQARVRELGAIVADVEEWTKKAVAYVRSVKSHGRGTDGKPALFDIRRVLEHDLQPLLVHRIRLAGGALTIAIDAEVPDLYGDGGRLGQALANLINNAIDACEGLPPERAVVRVDVERDGNEVVVRVADRGTGIPEAVRARIFEEFYTTKPPGRGTGLGLSIARDIVSGDFGGTLACTGAGPEGTTFAIRIPIPSATRGGADGPKPAKARDAA
jgi:signal transduction histidine kinase